MHSLSSLMTHFHLHSVKRTKVIDDQSDYFASDTNRWLSDNERKKLKAREDQLREQRHASRRQRWVTSLNTFRPRKWHVAAIGESSISI